MQPESLHPIGNLVYKSGVLDKILVDGGFISAADMAYHFFVADHLGNTRVVANAAGLVEQNYHYYPDGQSIDDWTQIEFDNPYKWSGKEWDEGLGAYDFGARLFAPADSRWTTPDPLAEKYYHISTYAYCAGDPVNLVDPDGMQWYSYTDENGYTKYEYREGEMSDEEKDKYKDLKDLGYFFFDYKNHVYHSLFGKELNWGEKDNDWTIVELCNKVDRIIIDYAKDAYDTWSGPDRVNCISMGGR